MKNFYVKGTNTTPTMKFENNHLSIEGRSYPEDAVSFYGKVVTNLENLHTKKLIIDINLHYINTASSKMLLNIFKSVDKNTHIENAVVKWHFEEDDEDILEEGKIFEEHMIKTTFEFYMYIDA